MDLSTIAALPKPLSEYSFATVMAPSPGAYAVKMLEGRRPQSSYTIPVAYATYDEAISAAVAINELLQALEALTGDNQ